MGLLTYRLALSHEYLGNEEKAIELFKSALKVLELTHGKYHSIYKNVQRKLR